MTCRVSELPGTSEMKPNFFFCKTQESRKPSHASRCKVPNESSQLLALQKRSCSRRPDGWVYHGGPGAAQQRPPELRPHASTPTQHPLPPPAAAPSRLRSTPKSPARCCSARGVDTPVSHSDVCECAGGGGVWVWVLLGGWGGVGVVRGQACNLAACVAGWISMKHPQRPTGRRVEPHKKILVRPQVWALHPTPTPGREAGAGPPEPPARPLAPGAGPPDLPAVAASSGSPAR